ncbi:hypothetical protein DPEC_G00144240 [Dallia pectoralis]|uniref:Uncharacterized protein n=1 Tax=Dallia pectoralis TaxID=75939 RepID=A0ACC2GNI8_DALPE|nr:hypothetical protein DPEC_G00144240 [Dallia pectoralis]
MTKVEILRVLLNERLLSAAEEIFGVFEKTIVEFQEEVSRTKEENSRLRSMLDVVIKPEIRLLRIDLEKPTVPVHEQPDPFEGQQHCKPEWSHSPGQVELEARWIKAEPREPESSLKDANHFQDSTQFSLHETDMGEYDEIYTLPSYSTQSGVKNLRDHMKIHPTEKSLHCSDCGKYFRKQYDLTNHMRVHTGERPYACQFCDKVFAQNGNLAVHMKSHSEKKHHCPRLIAAAEEIFGVVEETIAGYQEEASRTKKENGRLRSMLDVCTKPEMLLTIRTRDHEQLTVVQSDEEDPSMQPEASCNLVPDLEPTHIKEEQEEPRTSNQNDYHINEKCFSTSSMLKRHQTAAHKQIGAMSAANGALLDSVHGEARPDGFPEQEPVIMPFAGDENQAAD